MKNDKQIKDKSYSFFHISQTMHFDISKPIDLCH